MAVAGEINRDVATAMEEAGEMEEEARDTCLPCLPQGGGRGWWGGVGGRGDRGDGGGGLPLFHQFCFTNKLVSLLHQFNKFTGLTKEIFSFLEQLYT